MRWLRGIVLGWAVCLGTGVSGLELSTIVMPSEDEAVEALENGDITYYQYLQLREIIVHGIDSTSLYLLDEIPNLVFFRESNRPLSDPAEAEQLPGVVKELPTATKTGLVTGRLGYRFYQRLEESEQTWYRSSGNVLIADRYRVRFQLDREQSGRERVVSRSLSYSARNSTVRRLVLGSFTTRLGLGTLFGYAGKKLDYANSLSGESLIYPDYGGYNGVLVEAQPGPLNMTGLVSVQRDTQFRLVSAGLMTQIDSWRGRPGVIIGQNHVTNRETGERLSLVTFGLHGEHRYGSGVVEIETSRQTGDRISAGSVVVEGRHRFESAELRYSAWSYSDDLIELTIGSKSGYLSRTDTLAQVGLRSSSKRAGQSGLLIKSVVQLSDKLKFSNAILYAARSSRHQRQQFSSSLGHRLTKDCSFLLTYLGKFRRNPEDTDAGTADHRIRLANRLLADRWSIRYYIGYDAQANERGHACLFGSLRYRTEVNARVEVWSNWGDVGTTGVNYWYLFVRAEWPMIKQVRLAVKLSNSYRRGSLYKNRAQLLLELNANL